MNVVCCIKSTFTLTFQLSKLTVSTDDRDPFPVCWACSEKVSRTRQNPSDGATFPGKLNKCVATEYSSVVLESNRAVYFVLNWRVWTVSGFSSDIIFASFLLIIQDLNSSNILASSSVFCRKKRFPGLQSIIIRAGDVPTNFLVDSTTKKNETN